MISEGLLEQLAAAVAAELAPRVASELAGTATSGEEPWRLWTLEDVVARLGRSERTVREWAKRGDLPFIRLDGGALAFLPDDVKAFAQARRVPEVLDDRLQPPRPPASSVASRAPHRADDRRVDG